MNEQQLFERVCRVVALRKDKRVSCERCVDEIHSCVLRCVVDGKTTVSKVIANCSSVKAVNHVIDKLLSNTEPLVCDWCMEPILPNEGRRGMLWCGCDHYDVLHEECHNSSMSFRKEEAKWGDFNNRSTPMERPQSYVRTP